VLLNLAKRGTRRRTGRIREERGAQREQHEAAISTMKEMVEFFHDKVVYRTPFTFIICIAYTVILEPDLFAVR
jgi:hypothetical protein